ncbi:MAG: RusA family crossover junction endodeoxyribonuclease [bacterium]|nr:RusA family crossover junction endodeoxyribonuclease [bacterium]
MSHDKIPRATKQYRLREQDPVSFEVFGTPRPKGSKKAYVMAGKAILVECNQKLLVPWKRLVTAAAVENRPPRPIKGPVEVTLYFWFERPRAHFRAGKYKDQRKPAAPYYHSYRPDIDKLARAVLDCLTGIVYEDDAQVCVLNMRKAYSDSPKIGVSIDVRPKSELEVVRREDTDV